MEIIDKVYGEEEINELVLIDLINCDSVQRLKEVSQFGIPDKYYHKKNGFSRYDHSIGVLILLRRMKANLNEQIAGLLHDVSHTAFSHVVDWVIGDSTKEDYQDNIHLEIIKSSEIPCILKKYNIYFEDIFCIENFSLLESEAPSLCANRIDYALREVEDLGLIKKVVSNLLNVSGKIVFQDKEIAEIFARIYTQLQNEHWAGNQAVARYYILSRTLKRAMEKEIISLEDFRNTDDFVIELLIKSDDDEILADLDLLRKGFKVESGEEGLELKKKFRFVDPDVFFEDKIVCLTNISSEYKTLLDEEKEKYVIKNKLKIIPY